MEEQPFIAEWDSMSETPNVVVVPFFISDGLHSYQDIPVMLGIEAEVVRSQPDRGVRKTRTTWGARNCIILRDRHRALLPT